MMFLWRDGVNDSRLRDSCPWFQLDHGHEAQLLDLRFCLLGISRFNR